MQIKDSLYGKNIVCNKCDGFGKIVKFPCKVCGGEGSETKFFNENVKVPAGIADG